MSSKLELLRKDKKNFFIEATIYLQDRDEYFLTRNLDPRAFRQGNQFDAFWRNRCQTYIELMLRQLYNYRVPAGATFQVETCMRVGKRTVVQRRGGRNVNARIQTSFRTFKIHLKLARPDDLQDDIDFDRYVQNDRNGQYVRIDDITATPYD